MSIACFVQGVFFGWMTAASWSMMYMTAIRNPTIYGFLTGREPPAARVEAQKTLFDVLPVSETEEAVAVSAPEGGDTAAASGQSETQSPKV